MERRRSNTPCGLSATTLSPKAEVTKPHRRSPRADGPTALRLIRACHKILVQQFGIGRCQRCRYPGATAKGQRNENQSGCQYQRSIGSGFHQAPDTARETAAGARRAPAHAIFFAFLRLPGPGVPGLTLPCDILWRCLLCHRPHGRRLGFKLLPPLAKLMQTKSAFDSQRQKWGG